MMFRGCVPVSPFRRFPMSASVNGTASPSRNGHAARRRPGIVPSRNPWPAGEHVMGKPYRVAGRKVYYFEFRDQHGVLRKNVSSGVKDLRAAEAIKAKVQGDADRLRAGEPPQHLEV